MGTVRSAQSRGMDPDAIPESARTLAARTDADRIADVVSEEIAQRVYPDRLDDAAFIDAMDRSVRENVRAIVLMFEGRIDLDQLNPLNALAFADVSAELDIPVSELERAYWIGVATFWREWFDIAAEAAADDGSLPDLLGAPTMALFSYIDTVLLSVVSRYDVARADLIRTREHLRRSVLTQILEGQVAEESEELDRALGYRLGGHHLGLVIELGERRRVESELAALQNAGRAANAMLHQQGVRTWHAWLGRHDPFEPRDLVALRRALDASGSRIGVGDPARGLEGLKLSREQAIRAARVQRALEATGSVTWYADVRLEALLLSDELGARRFVAEELGPLAAPDARCGRIRETLLIWLSTGSQAATAGALGVHENTVRLRIRQAEDLLPGVLSQRRTELQVALRLHRALGHDLPDAPS